MWYRFGCLGIMLFFWVWMCVLVVDLLLCRCRFRLLCFRLSSMWFLLSWVKVMLFCLLIYRLVELMCRFMCV